MKPYIEVADETQRVELAKWDKAENEATSRAILQRNLKVSMKRRWQKYWSC
jgi:hypothetical protein